MTGRVVQSREHGKHHALLDNEQRRMTMTRADNTLANFLITLICITALLTAQVAMGQIDQNQTNPSDVATPTGASRLIVDRIPAPSLAGNLFGDSTLQPIAIYLPPSYETSKTRYPVIYFLPGFGDGISLYLDGTYQGFKLQAAMDSLIQVGAIKEMIVVIVNGRNRLGGSFYTNSPATGNWEDYVVKELVRVIDSRYRTILYAGSRGLAGHSMGGSGALSLGMHHPDVFGSVYAMSPGLFDDNGLSESPMFANERTIRDYLNLENELKTLSRLEAATRLDIIFDSLLSNQRWDLVFTLAYGAAFSARPSANAPHIDYPYSLRNDSLILDSLTWKRWEKGFGDPAAKVAQYQSLPERLRTIGIEYGVKDENPWIPRGCQYFSQLLTKQNIAHQLFPFQGGHQDSLGTRMSLVMLPFFSERLLEQKSKNSESNTKPKTTPTKRKK
jgi:S-formylglutathione hydrolase